MVSVQKRKQSGFTLIELVMVIVIIGVLSAIIVPNFLDYVGRSEAATTKANLSVLRNAIQTYRSENGGSWPANDLSDLAPTYIAAIPSDGVEESADVVNTQDGNGGWHWNTTSNILKPNLNGADAYGKNYADY